MIERRLAARIRRLLRDFPAVAVLGPRRVGKTTLALDFLQALRDEAVYLDLELPSDRSKLADAEVYLSSHEDRLVILDEIHRLPGIFQTLRSLIDWRARKAQRSGQFLLLGSAAVHRLQHSPELLAGRIAYLHLTPFAIDEIAGDARVIEDLWARGGFPESFLARGDAGSLGWRTAFIQTYLERYLPSMGPRMPAETVSRYCTMLAHNQGQMLNAAQLAANLGVSGTTVARYLDILVDLLLVRRLPPWASNARKRLVKTPKVYVRDSGLVHALLGIRDFENLLGHPVVGSSWEGFLIENVVSALPDSARASFYRTSAGAEIDLVIEFNSRERWAIEIKRSVSDPSPSKGFHIGCDDIKAARRIVLYPGGDEFKLDELTRVMNVASLLREIRARRKR